MAKNETRRLKPSTLVEDLELYAALKAIPGYAPSNPAYTQAAIDAIKARLTEKAEIEAQAAAAYESARDDHVAVQWEIHNAMLGAKDQVVAQFGPNSNEVQAMKLKKKTEYKNPTRKAPAKS